MTLRTVIDYKADPKNTIVGFVGHRFCCETLDQKFNLRKADSTKLGFQAGDVLYFSENFDPQEFIHAIFMFGRWYKRVNLLIEFLNTVFIKFYF